MMALCFDLGACCLKSAMGTCRESPLGVEPLPGWHSRKACALPTVRRLWGAEMFQVYGCVVAETRAVLLRRCAIGKVTVSQGHSASDLVIEVRKHLRQVSVEPLESVCS